MSCKIDKTAFKKPSILNLDLFFTTCQVYSSKDKSFFLKFISLYFFTTTVPLYSVF